MDSTSHCGKKFIWKQIRLWNLLKNTKIPLLNHSSSAKLEANVLAKHVWLIKYIWGKGEIVLYKYRYKKKGLIWPVGSYDITKALMTYLLI